MSIISVNVKYIKSLLMFVLPMILVGCSFPTVKNSDDAVVVTNSGSSIRVQAGAVEANDAEDILRIQKADPAAILNMDCTKFKNRGKIFCEQQKAFFESQKDVYTWEKVREKGSEYAKSFDCQKIASPFGQKYCQEYQKNTGDHVDLTKSQVAEKIKKDVEAKAKAKISATSTGSVAH